jgi:hypothetical protein
VRGIGADFFERWGESQGMRVLPPGPDDGLVDGLTALAGPGFDPQAVHEAIHDFYAQTVAYDLRIESRWSGPFRPIGWLRRRGCCVIHLAHARGWAYLDVDAGLLRGLWLGAVRAERDGASGVRRGAVPPPCP